MLLVLELGLLVLALDHDARRIVGDAHGGVGAVHVLAAGAAGAEHVDAQVLLLDVDLDVRVNVRVHVHRGKGRVPAARGVKGRDADQPVDARLALEQAEGVRPGDLQGDALDARLVAVEPVQFVHLEAA